MAEIQLADGCLLRPFVESDMEELHGLIAANRDYLGRWLPWAASQTPEDTLEFIRKGQQQLDNNDGFQGALVCEGAIAGAVGYHRVDWVNGSTSLGYWLGEDRQGRGTMTEAVRALVDHAFLTWSLNRVEIRVAVDNRRSRAIPERLGFQMEGVLRGAERVGDRYLDTALYSILAGEWPANRG
jgi:ribosomal-protein-serine acetyltransferase